jgi:hypothetical protein
MTADRFFFPAVLAACAALTLLSAAEPARVASVQAQAAAAAPIVQLERVVITAAREEGPREVASAEQASTGATSAR